MRGFLDRSIRGHDESAVEPRYFFHGFSDSRIMQVPLVPRITFDRIESCRLGTLEHRYLSVHAGMCLATLAGQLRQADGFYSELGLALDALLEDEIRAQA